MVFCKRIFLGFYYLCTQTAQSTKGLIILKKYLSAYPLAGSVRRTKYGSEQDRPGLWPCGPCGSVDVKPEAQPMS